MTYPIRPLAAPVWRMIHPKYHRSPFSGEGARLAGGRWNQIGQPALYFAADHATAVAEYYQNIPRPGTLAPYWVEGAVADLTDGGGEPADPRIADAVAADWKTIARIEHRVPPGWALTQELVAAGVAGVIAPSAQNPAGKIVVLWRWHDAREPGEGAALTLLDPEAALTGGR